MPATAGTPGANLNLLIRQGSDFCVSAIAMQNPDGSPMDLTGFLFRGEIRKTGLDTGDPVATFVCEINDPPTDGVWSFSLTHFVTSSIACGETLNSPDSQYVYDIEMVDTLYRVLPCLYGNVQVQREVTR